jgi:hypothetical protein
MPLIRGHYSVTNPTWLGNGSPSGMFRENLPLGRLMLASNLSALTTQVMTSTWLPLETGDIVTSLTFLSGGTAAGTPTNWWFALYDTQATPALIAQTADQLTAAWAANTAKTLALSAPYLVPKAGVYQASIMMKATTPVTLAGLTLENAAAAGAIVSGQLPLAQTSGSSLTTTAPGTIATPTTVATIPYVIAT